jgi:hypothetical protein
MEFFLQAELGFSSQISCLLIQRDTLSDKLRAVWPSHA